MKLRPLLPLAALLAIALPARSAKVTVVTTTVDTEVTIRERTGNSSKIIKKQRGLPNRFGADTTELNVKHRSGTLATSGRGFAQFYGNRNQLQPSFHCQAKGENTADSTAPAGRSGDNVTTFSTVKMTETLALEGKRFGALTLGSADFDIEYEVHGKVEHTGDTSVAHGRIELKVSDSSGGTTFSSLDPSTLFDGQRHKRYVSGTLSTLRSQYEFTFDLLAVACIAKYKKCMVNADNVGTVAISGVTLTTPTGLRFEVPEITSASGFDYNPLLNIPDTSSGIDEFAFASDLLAVGENDGTLLVRVHRESAGAGPASVVVRNKTVPMAGVDFEPFSTTLDFAAGETRKFVLVKLIDDTTAQNSRTFEIELANATGAGISAAHGVASVTLDDDDLAFGPNDPFGSYTCLINPGGAAGQIGLFTFTANENQSCTFGGALRGGKFSGRSTLGQMDFIGGGKTVNVPNVGAVKIIALVCESPNGVPEIIGTATLPDSTVLPIRGTKVHAQEDQRPPTSKRGYYTLLLDPPANAPADAPKGSGFAKVKVLPTGKVTIAGKFADGTPLSAGGTLNVLRQLPLLVVTKTKGELSGLLNFRSIPGVSDIDGDLRWTRPFVTKPSLFSGGFNTRLVASGARYVTPAADGYILPYLEQSSAKAIFHAESPDLAATLNRQLTIGVAPKNTVTADLPNAERLAIKLTGTTGLWSGSFLEAGKTLKFSGALHLLGNRGAGYFLGTTQSGLVTLEPGTLGP